MAVFQAYFSRYWVPPIELDEDNIFSVALSAVRWLVSAESIVRDGRVIHEKLADKGQILIFLNNKKGIKRLAGKLQEAGFAADYVSSDREEKAEIVARFVGGHGKVLCATSCLSAGVNLPHVLWTIHLGKPSSLIDFIQESGRAGRKPDQLAGSIVFRDRPGMILGSPDPKSKPKEKTENPFDLSGGLLRSFMRDHGTCRRMLLSTYFDGVLESCETLASREASTRFCDLCAPLPLSCEDVFGVPGEQRMVIERLPAARPMPRATPASLLPSSSSGPRRPNPGEGTRRAFFEQLASRSSSVSTGSGSATGSSLPSSGPIRTGSTAYRATPCGQRSEPT